MGIWQPDRSTPVWSHFQSESMALPAAYKLWVGFYTNTRMIAPIGFPQNDSFAVAVFFCFHNYSVIPLLRIVEIH